MKTDDTIKFMKAYEDLELFPNGLFVYLNNQASLYKKKHGSKEIILESTPKFHVTSCTTVMNEINKGRADRYSIAIHKTNVFDLEYSYFNGVKNEGALRLKLQVCQNCLKKLNYKNWINASQTEREEILKTFDHLDFYDKSLPQIERALECVKDYTFSVKWSEKKQSFIGACRKFPNFSSEEATPVEAFKGIVFYVRNEVLNEGE